MNILKLMETLKVRRRIKGGKAWVLFIDLKSAFDKVDHGVMFGEMQRLGISQQMIETIRWVYDETRFEVGGEYVEIGNGVI